MPENVPLFDVVHPLLRDDAVPNGASGATVAEEQALGYRRCLAQALASVLEGLLSPGTRNAYQVVVRAEILEEPAGARLVHRAWLIQKAPPPGDLFGDEVDHANVAFATALRAVPGVMDQVWQAYPASPAEVEVSPDPHARAGLAIKAPRLVADLTNRIRAVVTPSPVPTVVAVPGFAEITIDASTVAIAGFRIDGPELLEVRFRAVDLDKASAGIRLDDTTSKRLAAWAGSKMDWQVLFGDDKKALAIAARETNTGAMTHMMASPRFRFVAGEKKLHSFAFESFVPDP
jgi:hypothetical protein